MTMTDILRQYPKCDPDHIQHGIGPYRWLTIDGTKPMRYVVGMKDRYTNRNWLPNDGAWFHVDDPVLGMVTYDEMGLRVVQDAEAPK